MQPRRLLAIFVSAAVLWWLFGDLTRKHLFARAELHRPIRFAHFGGYEDYLFWSRLLDEFRRKHPDIDVTQEYVVGMGGEYNTRLRQQALAKSLPDVALIQLAAFRELSSHFARLTDFAQPLSDFDPADFDPTAIGAYRVDGELRGIPITGGSLAIYANEECFRRAERFHGHNIPRPSNTWTMDDFHRTAESLTCDFNGDGRIDQFGFWLPRWIYYLPFLWSFGAEVTAGEPSAWSLHGENAEHALRFYRNLAADRRVCPKDDEVPQLFQDTGFLTGQVAMCVNGPWFQSFLAHTKLADSYLVAPVPLGSAGRFTRVTWDAVVLADKLPPDRAAAAMLLIEFIASRDMQDEVGRSGRAVPARIESQSTYLGQPPDARRAVFAEASGYGRLQPHWPNFSEVDRLINRTLDRIAVSETPPDIPGILNELAKNPTVAGKTGAPRRESP